MIVFDLKCGGGHVFEAWFGSSAAYEAQRSGGLLACPMCGSDAIEKAVMAPNVAAKGNQRAETPVPALPSGQPPSPEAIKTALATLAAAQAKALEGSQWVGSSFATRARAMHDGDEPHAQIHGQATLEQAKELIDDGVAVAPLPFPVVPPEACN
ncbi:DUF1178 family protein [Sphingomonas sp. G-3-2-10]|uniref:DUF1178 family protein n=1 Tax=Sphingomonas sp. G-3-2-10 TaxID=2728838 RepID=UPI00146BF8F3|nr:DUF1178 family protein [Sphingomonas sp. G-3-2-10]